MLADSSLAAIDKKAVQLGRKKLLAELELGAGDGIEIKNILFSKNDIIAYFEDLQKDNIVAYYRTVDEDKVLRTFLEEYYIGEGQRFGDAGLYRDESFIGWISPYFFAAFTSFADNCFENAGDIGLEAMLANPMLMTGQDIERSWLHISRILTDNMSLLHEYQRQDKKKKEVVKMVRVAHLLLPAYLKMIILLPAHRFSELKDKYAFIMMQVCIYVFNRDLNHRALAVACLENTIPMAVSEDMQAELVAKLKEMNGIRARRWKRLAWRAVFAAVIILSTMRSAFDSSDSQLDGLKNAPVYILTPRDSAGFRDTIRRLLTHGNIDSILRNPSHKIYRRSTSHYRRPPDRHTQASPLMSHRPAAASARSTLIPEVPFP